MLAHRPCELASRRCPSGKRSPRLVGVVPVPLCWCWRPSDPALTSWPGVWRTPLPPSPEPSRDVSDPIFCANFSAQDAISTLDFTTVRETGSSRRLKPPQAHRANHPSPSPCRAVPRAQLGHGPLAPTCPQAAAQLVCAAPPDGLAPRAKGASAGLSGRLSGGALPSDALAPTSVRGVLAHERPF
jgi:hypothetical protein